MVTDLVVQPRIIQQMYITRQIRTWKRYSIDQAATVLESRLRREKVRPRSEVKRNQHFRERGDLAEFGSDIRSEPSVDVESSSRVFGQNSFERLYPFCKCDDAVSVLHLQHLGSLQNGLANLLETRVPE